MAAENFKDMFRPPLCLGARTLDRSFFQKTIPLKAARVFDNKNISRIRSELERSKDALNQDRLGSVFFDPDPERAKMGKKCIVLRPEVRQNNVSVSLNGDAIHEINDNSSLVPSSWPHSAILSELTSQGLISIIPFQLHLDYNYWTYHDIISSILPEDAQGEIPSGFSLVGHVAHLNLREDYLPYKELIAEILVDKNPGLKTVINKVDEVGEENEYRTFRYEVLRGPDDLNVEVGEGNCTFRFDYSKVYWNPRLQTEHSRLVSLFKEGEAVCDVMAGVGPFAVPAAKKGVFVWANDLNPESFRYLQDAVTRNKVANYVKTSNEDGRTFIRSAVTRLLRNTHQVSIHAKKSRKDPVGTKALTPIKTIHQPKVFQHFVLNLPASALTFLPSFIGIFDPSLRSELSPNTQMPIVHVYCFGTKDELAEDEASISAEQTICGEISQQLDHRMEAGKIEDDKVEIHQVRDVAPKKRMYCASFRLPVEVAFRSPGASSES